MENEILIKGLEGIPLIQSGDDISEIIMDSLKKIDLGLLDGDIILIAQSIISKSLGLIRNLKDINPSEQALKMYEKMKKKTEEIGMPIKEPELIQAIIDESREIIAEEHVLITETKHGFICANAGVDKSNVDGENNITTLPSDSDEEAEKIRKKFKEIMNKDVAVIITDSFGRAFRVGATGVAIGVSGIEPLIDRRGDKDLYGRILQSTIVGQVDNLAAAAQLIMGEANEGLPVILIRGYKFKMVEKSNIKPIIRDKTLDLFTKKDNKEYLDKIVKERRSYKVEFADKSVDKKLIEECIDLARWAPSAHNRQHWRYIILEQNQKRERLIDSMNKKMRSDLTLDKKNGAFIESKVKRTRNNFLKAPILIVLCLDTTELDEYMDVERKNNEFILGVQSISASAAYLLLTFHSRYLASCWYCAPLFTREMIKKELNLPASFEAMAFITVGYPKMQPKTPARRDLSEIIYRID